ncbi:hypothetical protein GJ496_002757 [Pomphorhynchus laevis]|nr:hypothetical protein GJ496_002757 [Pomphorhynchus laevis]
MNRLFGTKKEKPTPPNLNECVASIDGRAEAIERKIEKFNIDLKKLSEQMSKLRDGQAKTLLRRRAINLLRQRKQYEQQLDLLRQQSFNIGQQGMTLESVKDNQLAVSAMKSGVVQMKREMKKINFNEIDKLQDDLEDYMYQADELQEALGRNYQVPDYNEEELEAELEAISADMDDVEYKTEGNNYLDEIERAPTVPVSTPDKQQKLTSSTIQTDEFGLPVLPNRL